MTKRHPGLLWHFGGHSMAAGCTIDAENFGTFAKALRSVAEEGLTAGAGAGAGVVVC